MEQIVCPETNFFNPHFLATLLNSVTSFTLPQIKNRLLVAFIILLTLTTIAQLLLKILMTVHYKQL